MSGTNAAFADAFALGHAGEDADGLALRVAHDVGFPTNGAAVRAEPVRAIGREVTQAEFVIGHGEHARGEVFRVRLPGPVDVSRAPAAVQKFPFPVVDLDGVPCVCAVLPRDGVPRFQRGEGIPLAVAADDDGFETGFRSDGGEEAGVAFADGQTGGEGRGRGGGLDIVVEEGDGVVGDVVVEPGEDAAGLICLRVCERAGQLCGQPVKRWDG